MEILNHIHSILRWVILILLIATIIKSFNGMRNNTEYLAQDKKFALFTLIVAHIQLLIGLVQYFAGPWGLKNIQNNGMGTVMKDSFQRFFAVEHILMMLIAIVLITVGYSSAKKIIDSRKKYKKIFIFYLIALILILAAIPWPFRGGFESAGWY